MTKEGSAAMSGERPMTPCFCGASYVQKHSLGCPRSERRAAMSGERTGLPRLSVREYEQRPGAFYIAVGSTGRWIIDDREQAERIVAVYNAAIPAPPDSEAVLRPILVNLFDPENAGGGHGRWVPEDDAEDFWLADDDGCSLLVSAADGAALINHFLAASGEAGE